MNKNSHLDCNQCGRKSEALELFQFYVFASYQSSFWGLILEDLYLKQINFTKSSCGKLCLKRAHLKS